MGWFWSEKPKKVFEFQGFFFRTFFGNSCALNYAFEVELDPRFTNNGVFRRYYTVKHDLFLMGWWFLLETIIYFGFLEAISVDLTPRVLRVDLRPFFLILDFRLFEKILIIFRFILVDKSEKLRLILSNSWGHQIILILFLGFWHLYF